jgi:hypothetical protein
VKAWKAKNGRRRVRLWTEGTFPAIDLHEGDDFFEYLWGRLHSFPTPKKQKSISSSEAKKRGRRNVSRPGVN